MERRTTRALTGSCKTIMAAGGTRGRPTTFLPTGTPGVYNANDIRCDEGECWWSLRLDAHARRVAAAFRAGGSKP